MGPGDDELARLKFLYRQVCYIRKVELLISDKYHEQKMRCPVHLSIGQEAVAVGLLTGVPASHRKVISAHRSHAHYLAAGGDLESMFAELMGKATGCASGYGGSMHLIDHSAGFVAAVPIVGSSIPIAVGFSMADKIRAKSDVTFVFLGDGATEEGAFFESLDLAVLNKLNIIFVVEDNKFSVYTHKTIRQSPQRSLESICKGMGLSYHFISSADASEINQNFGHIMANKTGPLLIEIPTYRYLEHCGPNNDDHLNYRAESEVKYWKENDPIQILEERLLSIDCQQKDWLEVTQTELDAIIWNAWDKADQADLNTNIGLEYV